MSIELLIAVASGVTIVAILLRRPEWWRDLVSVLRAAPVELGLIVVAIGGAVAALAGDSLNVGLVLAGLVLALLLAGRHAVEDYVLGVFVRVSKNIRVGDTIVIDAHEGVVAEIGRLNVQLDDARGRLIVPHSKIARALVHRRTQRVGPLPHRFQLMWDGDEGHPEIAAAVRRTALLSPWCVAGKEPEVEPIGARTVTVTVYTVDNAHGYEVERAIRDVVGSTSTSAPPDGPIDFTLPPPT